MTSAIETDLPWANEPYSIKRHGCAITHCDLEPIQTPGCIQAHGAMLIVGPGDLAIRQASENSTFWLGHSPDRLLGAPVSLVVGEAGADRLRELLDTRTPERNPVYAFSLPARGETGPLDITLHTHGEVAILEFEAAGRREGAPPDYYPLLNKTVSRLQGAVSLLDFCRAAAEEFRELTGLDRVMIYRFHPDYHGEVFAESKRADLAPWLGLHYPAEDIPKPARDIFGKIWIRPLPDAKAPPIELVPLVDPDTGKPPDLTYCALRGGSAMYTEYLRNMGVAASLTMPIRRAGQLWGLIACHHYTPTSFPYQIRAACEFLAQVVSLLMASVTEREHLAYRIRIQSVHAQSIASASGEAGLSALVNCTPNLLSGIEADGVALYHEGHWSRAGRTPDENQLRALADWLSARPELQSPARPIYATDSLAGDYSGGAALAGTASGVLAVSVSQVSRHLLLWFRTEAIQTIDWAGNPHDLPTVPGPNGPRLTPRASFELFRESVNLRSLPWKEVEIQAALELRQQLMQVVINRAEHLAALNAELLRSNEELNTFAYVASHDLKEPLRGIFKNAHLMLENSKLLEEESRQRLESLMRLTRRMDSLLESLLHFSRIGRTQLAFETSELGDLLEEALEMVCARREEAHTEIVIPRPMPAVKCDRVRVREVFCNLLDNALKYNDKPLRRIEIGYLAPGEAGEPGMPEQRAGQLVLYVRDNGIGISPRHHAQVFKMFKRLHGRDEYGGGTGAGLCIARMLVERHHGQIWFDSVPGAGSTFYFTLPLGEPPADPPILPRLPQSP